MDFATKTEVGGLRDAQHIHCVFLYPARRFTTAFGGEITDVFGRRWRGIARGQGLVFDSDERTDRGRLKAENKWNIDPVNCSDPAALERFVEYVVGYLTKDKGQMLCVKSAKHARTMTTGRKP